MSPAAPANSFSPELEADFIRTRLRESRALIRIACSFALVLTLGRAAEQFFVTTWDATLAASFTFVLASSVLLAALAWSPWFERAYLPWATVTIPIRCCIVAAYVGKASAHGQAEMLMLLPILLLGPVFFLGLRYRAAVFCAVPTVIAFAISATHFGLALPTALRAYAFLVMSVVAGAIAARYMETWSRTAFLEGRATVELAQRDGLTGTRNRRVFDEHLLRLWQQASEDRRSLAILLIDVDHFKAYNDRYGHQAGDDTLRAIAQSVQGLIWRPLDILTRYGGEEFAALLYDVNANRAWEMAERMRRTVIGLAIEHRGSRTAETVTISVGIAALEPSAERNPRGGLQLADQALYEAKTRGRNRVELLDDAEHTLLTTGVFPNLTSGAADGGATANQPGISRVAGGSH